MSCASSLVCVRLNEVTTVLRLRFRAVPVHFSKGHVVRSFFRLQIDVRVRKGARNNSFILLESVCSLVFVRWNIHAEDARYRMDGPLFP